jgi:hypothetical protein
MHSFFIPPCKAAYKSKVKASTEMSGFHRQKKGQTSTSKYGMGTSAEAIKSRRKEFETWPNPTYCLRPILSEISSMKI